MKKINNPNPQFELRIRILGIKIGKIRRIWIRIPNSNLFCILKMHQFSWKLILFLFLKMEESEEKVDKTEDSDQGEVDDYFSW